MGAERSEPRWEQANRGVPVLTHKAAVVYAEIVAVLACLLLPIEDEVART